MIRNTADEDLARFNNACNRSLYLHGPITDEELSYIDICDLEVYIAGGLYRRLPFTSKMKMYGYKNVSELHNSESVQSSVNHNI